MNTQYEVAVVKDGRLLIYVTEYTKKKARTQVQKFRKEFPDCVVQVFFREDEELDEARAEYHGAKFTFDVGEPNVY